jgi:hypothetical protein
MVLLAWSYAAQSSSTNMGYPHIDILLGKMDGNGENKNGNWE